MAIAAREVKNKRDSNGILTGHSGLVYDVNIKYKIGKQSKTYVKKGFLTKKEAQQHEVEMKNKFFNPSYVPPTTQQTKMTVEEYLSDWVEQHGKRNLRPSTLSGYRGHLKNHIFPCIGHVPLVQLTPAMLNQMFQQLFDEGLSNGTVKYAHRIMSVSLEHARKYHYIERNPIKDILTKFGKDGKTPDPYTIEQIRTLLGYVKDSDLELVIILGGLYGLRISEIVGLRWRNVDFEHNTFQIIEQLPFQLPYSAKTVSQMAPVKAGERTLPITEITKLYFVNRQKLQQTQKAAAMYYDNGLVIAKPNGSPYNRHNIYDAFVRCLKRHQMPHIRLHDLRHTAATNMLPADR